MQPLFCPAGGVSEDAWRFATGFFQVSPLAVPAWDSDPTHTNRPRRLLGESTVISAYLQFNNVHFWSRRNSVQFTVWLTGEPFASMHLKRISAVSVKWAGLMLSEACINFILTNCKADVVFMQDLIKPEQIKQAESNLAHVAYCKG